LIHRAGGWAHPSLSSLLLILLGGGPLFNGAGRCPGERLAPPVAATSSAFHLIGVMSAPPSRRGRCCSAWSRSRGSCVAVVPALSPGPRPPERSGWCPPARQASR